MRLGACREIGAGRGAWKASLWRGGAQYKGTKESKQMPDVPRLLSIVTATLLFLFLTDPLHAARGGCGTNEYCSSYSTAHETCKDTWYCNTCNSAQHGGASSNGCVGTQCALGADVCFDPSAAREELTCVACRDGFFLDDSAVGGGGDPVCRRCPVNMFTRPGRNASEQTQCICSPGWSNSSGGAWF